MLSKYAVLKSKIFWATMGFGFSKVMAVVAKSLLAHDKFVYNVRATFLYFRYYKFVNNFPAIFAILYIKVDILLRSLPGHFLCSFKCEIDGIIDIQVNVAFSLHSH